MGGNSSVISLPMTQPAITRKGTTNRATCCFRVVCRSFCGVRDVCVCVSMCVYTRWLVCRSFCGVRESCVYVFVRNSPYQHTNVHAPSTINTETQPRACMTDATGDAHDARKRDAHHGSDPDRRTRTRRKPHHQLTGINRFNVPAWPTPPRCPWQAPSGSWPPPSLGPFSCRWCLWVRVGTCGFIDLVRGLSSACVCECKSTFRSHN